jgi:uncharacterized membrane protein YeaQ/YmgE (transglycosylase-associated protein family)
MSYLIWLLVMGLCGWITGKIVGGKGLGVIADILLGITGALTVRFVLDALRVTVQDADAVLFSVWGAAGLAGLVRFVMKRREGRLSTGASRNAALSRTPDAASLTASGSEERKRVPSC